MHCCNELSRCSDFSIWHTRNDCDNWFYAVSWCLMANDSKRTSQLGITTILQANDRVVVLTNANTTIANTQTIAMSNFIIMIANNMPGPFANDSVANTNGITIKSPYYDTNGIIRIRLV